MQSDPATAHSGPVPRRGTGAREFLERHWSWAIPVLAILALAAPMILTQRSFNGDWISHLWELWMQKRTIARTGLPGYFVHAEPLGAFYPVFVFYGGTLFALAGYLALLTGPSFAYVAFFVLGFAMAYGGWTWLACQGGLEGWRAQLPGLVFATSAYYLSNAYARGTWAEFIATSAVPLVIASSVHLVRARRWTPAPLAAFAGAVVILTGSHNISLAWSAACLAFMALVMLWALPRHGRELDRGRLVRLAALGALAVGVNLWFLLPDVVYGGWTLVTSYSYDWGAPLFANVARARVIFDPLRFNPAGKSGGGFYPQVPVLALLWSLTALALGWHGLAQIWRRVAVGLTVLLVGLLGLVLFARPWAVVPGFLKYIQFPFRLHTYIALGVAGLVLIGLLAVARVQPAGRRTALTAALVTVLCLATGLAVWQVWSTPSGSSSVRTRDGAFASATAAPYFYPPAIFRDRIEPVVAVPPGRRTAFDVAKLQRGELRQRLALPPGPAPIATNVAAGPYLVRIEGLRRVGRTRDGFVVVERPRGRERGPVEASLALRRAAPFALGTVATAVSITGLLAVLGAVALRRRRRTGPQ